MEKSKKMLDVLIHIDEDTFRDFHRGDGWLCPANCSKMVEAIKTSTILGKDHVLKDTCYVDKYTHLSEYKLSRKTIYDYIDTFDNDFTNEQKDTIVENICQRLEGAVISSDDYKTQEFNFIEDAYIDAAICYIYSHNKSIDALLKEEDNAKIFKLMGQEKSEPEESYDDI